VSSDRVEIRPFRREDIGFALAQTAREGWDATAGLFETLLAHDPQGCFVAQCGGHSLGMITTTAHPESAWIGNLIVLPDRRRQGVGLQLMTYAMAHLTSLGITTMRLEADPPGVALYRRLGFVDEFESPRFENLREVSVERLSGGAPMPVERIDGGRLGEVTSFDARYFGDDRSRLLGLLLERARGAYCVSGGGEVRAYAVALPSAFGIRIGPWVAADGAAARAVLGAVLADFPGERYCVGVPLVNGDAVALLRSLDMRQTSSCLRMVYGGPAASGLPKHIYGIAGGAIG